MKHSGWSRSFGALLVSSILFLSPGASAQTTGIRIFVDGGEIHPDVPPQIVAGRVMVPARFIAEPLGADVEWDDSSKTVTICERGQERAMPFEAGTATGGTVRIVINGQTIQPDVQPQNIGGRVMVPARFIAEPLGATVRWDASARAVIINTRRLENKKSSSQITAPFSPTDIFVFDLPDWENLEVAQKAHATVVGSAHQAVDGRREDFLRESARLTEITSIAHNAGLKYTAHFTSDISGDFPDEASVACVDIDGNMVKWFMPTEEPRIWKSWHYPEWKAHLIERAKRVVDSHVDIICIDGWSLNYDVLVSRGFDGKLLNGDFSERSLAGFRDYLKGKYAAGELRDLGIADPDSFDYGQFIREKYLDRYKYGDRFALPFFKDFQDYQLITCKEFWRDIIQETKSYAAQKGQNILFTTNAAEFSIADGQHNYAGLAIADLVDGYMSEFMFGLPPHDKALLEYKLWRGIGKPVALIPNAGFSADLLSRPDIAELMKMYIAEAYASGEFTYVPYANIVNGPQGWKLYSADMNELYPYFDFIRSNKACFDDLVSAARTAVLYSYPSIRQNNRSASSFFGAVNLLTDSGHQFDVLFAGDDNWIADRLTGADLGMYDQVVLPNVSNMSDTQASLLLDYVARGGHVFAFGETGTRDATNAPVRRPELAGLLVEGSNRHGLGRFIYRTSNVGSTYLASRDEKTRRDVESILGNLIDRDIVVKNAGNVVATGYLDGTGSSIVHFVNYDYDANASHFSEKANIEVRVPLDRRLQGKDLEVLYLSPDWNGARRISHVVDQSTVSFQIPSLNVYGVALIKAKP